jgi:hypothetical protein
MNSELKLTLPAFRTLRAVIKTDAVIERDFPQQKLLKKGRFAPFGAGGPTVSPSLIADASQSLPAFLAHACSRCITGDVSRQFALT